MKQASGCSLVIVVLSMLAWACGPGGPSEGGHDTYKGDATLELHPAAATLAVVGGVPASQSFTAVLRHEDGTTEDVTAHTRFALGAALLGRLDGSTLEAGGLRGGEGMVHASFADLSAGARVTVRVERVRVAASTPSDAPALLARAAEDASLAPAIVSPTSGTLVPPNLGELEVHWTAGAGADLFEVKVTSRHVTLRTYVARTPEAGTGTTAPGANLAVGSWIALLPEEWALLQRSSRDEPLTITVRGMHMAQPAHAGTSSQVTVHLTDQPIRGGIYYWAAHTDIGAAGIYRHDMGRPGQAAEPFYTADQAPQGRCVACHALSRDGTRMAVTYDGGNHSATILDVATREELLPPDTFYWNFATFTPDSARILTTYEGAMTLRDTATGEALGRVDGAGYGTHPDFSPRGDAIVFVDVGDRGGAQDWSFTGGTLWRASFDPRTDTFGAPTPLPLADGDSGGNYYYPSWSPDGQWILFNRAGEDAYDAGSAELWVVAADGSAGPMRLDAPNIGPGLTNSWARWAPFAQHLGQEPLFWLTFSSKRDFGVRLVNADRPQIWMAPFFPERAARGEPPSAPAFRLPIQSLDSNNHIAQWTERVVSIVE